MQKVVSFTTCHTWGKNVGRVRLEGWGNAYIHGGGQPFAKRETRIGWGLESAFRNRFSVSHIRVGYIWHKANPHPHCIVQYVGMKGNHHGYKSRGKQKRIVLWKPTRDCSREGETLAGPCAYGNPITPPPLLSIIPIFNDCRQIHIVLGWCCGTSIAALRSPHPLPFPVVLSLCGEAFPPSPFRYLCHPQGEGSRVSSIITHYLPMPCRTGRAWSPFPWWWQVFHLSYWSGSY